MAHQSRPLERCHALALLPLLDSLAPRLLSMACAVRPGMDERRRATSTSTLVFIKFCAASRTKQFFGEEESVMGPAHYHLDNALVAFLP